MPVTPPGLYLDITGTEVSKVTDLQYMHYIGNYTMMKNIFEMLARISAVRTGTQISITVDNFCRCTVHSDIHTVHSPTVAHLLKL